jgi:hypothetical protein
LTAALARRFAELPRASFDELENVVESVREERSELFQRWTNGFSQEAQTINERLLGGQSLTIGDMGTCLRTAGFAPYRADRVSEELQFTGVAVRDGDRLMTVNAMYKKTMQPFASSENGTASEQEVWTLIREVETTLRRVVRKEFQQKWPSAADAQIQAILGNEAWSRLLTTQEKNERSYRFTARPLPEILDCAYLGQLGELMKSNASWSLFSGMFRDKRELEDILRDVTSVRNDSAHFRTVPERELDRCRLRCEDLLAIVSLHDISE